MIRLFSILILLSCTSAKIGNNIVTTNPINKTLSINNVTTFSKTYYFSSCGNDSDINTKQTPWKTFDKLNTIIINPGDSILLKRGDIFISSLEVDISGTVIQPIVVSAYGTGAKPILSGFKTVNFWKQNGNNYETLIDLGELTNMVTINGKQYAQGRYPNKGFLTYESHTGRNSITDNQLTQNWISAEVVVKPKRWILDRAKITGQSGGKIDFDYSLSYDPYDNYGYFFQNDIRTLDTAGEWYYNAGKLSINGLNTGDEVQAAYEYNLVSIDHRSNITFDNISFEGANESALYLNHADNIRIYNCDFNFMGTDGIFGTSCTGLVLENSTFNNTNNTAINLSYNCNGSVIRNNVIKNTGMIPGAGEIGDASYMGIVAVGKNNLIQGNEIDSTGFTAIKFSSGDSNIIKNNFINYFTLVKDDGGGINSGNYAKINYTGNKILGNIILNGIGQADGTDRPGTASSNGIYLDDNVSNFEVSGNTVANCGRSGIFIHNAFNISILNNTLFNNLIQLSMVHDIAFPLALLRNNIIKNNIFFSKTALQTVMNISTTAPDINLIGVIDSNYYCRPIDDNLIINTSYVNILGTRTDQILSLKGWQTSYGLDLNSKKTFDSIAPYYINSTGINKFANGKFNIDKSGIYSSAISSWVNKLDAGTLQLSNQLTTNALYQVTMSVGSILPNKNYLLKFSTLSTKDTIVKVYLRISGAPYTRLSDIKAFQVGTLRKENEFLFSLPLSTNVASIVFEIRSPGITIWMDNVSLSEADVIVVKPEDHIRFEYNNSVVNKIVNGQYKEVNGNMFNGIIPAYSSKILIY